MCGITCSLVSDHEYINYKFFKSLLKRSEIRGQDATGVAFWNKNNSVSIYRHQGSVKNFFQEYDCQKIIKQGESIVAMGHNRLQTNGPIEVSENNQPVAYGNLIGVHNGIVVNYLDLVKKYKINLSSELDSCALFACFDYFLKNNLTVEEAATRLLKEINGSVSAICLLPSLGVIASVTNTGSLYVVYDSDDKALFFCSEYLIVKDVCRLIKKAVKIVQLEANQVLVVSADSGRVLVNKATTNYDVKKNNTTIINTVVNKLNKKLVNWQTDDCWIDLFVRAKNKARALRRCVHCVLPITVPFIDIDASGVCRFCRHYSRLVVRSEKEIINKIKKYKRKGAIDCLVPFSGGRDSSYVLYQLNRLGFKTAAISYDWGMLTDLGRRNQARMVSRLGVEHIIVAANINQKRLNIKKNVLAWIKNPSLGMIPLFMAGDKQYYYYVNKYARNLGVRAIIYGHNPLEATYFKSGFAGVEPQSQSGSYYRLNVYNAAKLALFYSRQMLANPFYINSSLLDTFSAYISYYLISHESLDMFRFIEWNENKVNQVLRTEFDWELAPDTPNTWRIGDGTAPLYNYLYLLGAGFTEYDALRSNQIRQGHISRQQAMDLLEIDNCPRIESLEWYFKTIGLNANDVYAAAEKLFFSLQKTI
jgi:hypothetical protein